MKLKRFAVTGLITLAIVAAVCMYFSGTIINITTPKVKLLAVKQGKLESSVKITGTLVYTETKDITLTIPEESTLTIQDVLVRAGSQVQEGDPLILTQMSGYSTRMQTLQNEYADAVDALNEYIRKKSDITLSARDESYAAAYTAWKAANRTCSAAEINVKLLLSSEEITGWAVGDEDYPENASAELTNAIDTLREAKVKLSETEKTFAKANRYGIDDTTWEFIQERETLTAKVKECEAKCLELQAEAQKVATIKAPNSGYISAVNVKSGDSYTGGSAIYSITTVNGGPSLQFDLTDISKTVSKGDTINVTTNSGSVAVKVTSIDYNADRKRCAYVRVGSDLENAFGSLYNLSQQTEVEGTLVTRSTTSSSLVPVSAIHGSGNDRYVYIIDTVKSNLSGQTMTIRKISVTVAAESNGYAAVNEDLTYYKIAYMEDRSIEDGSTVMEYTK